MNAEWKVTMVYVAIAWVLFLCSEMLGDFGWELLALLGFFAALNAGAIALIIRLVLNIAHRRSILAPLAMVLAVLPLFFLAEIREGVTRAEDFFLRNARQQIIEQVMTGEIDADERGFAQLPEGKARLSEDGEFRVLEHAGKVQAVEFYNARAILGAAFSTVYCVNGDSPDEEALGANQVYECKPLSDGWYYVWYE